MFNNKTFTRVIALLSIVTLLGCSAATLENDRPTPTPEEQTDTDLITLPDTDLQKMDQSQDVRALQDALVQIGYHVEPNGHFDELTTWAITDLQLQDETLNVSGMYDQAIKQTLEQIIADEVVIEPRAAPAFLAPEQTDSGTPVIENPYDLLALVNKYNALPADYVPHDLVVPDVLFSFSEDVPKKQLRQVAADALEDLFTSAQAEGLYFYALSGYRSYDRQETLFNAYMNAHGEEAANKFSARPGESEHQSGLAMDVTSESVGFQLSTRFGETAEGIWLKERASEFGFIIRYPADKVAITEYQYEPWHLRYVGPKAAKTMVEHNLTLEEYLNVQ